jgi:glycine/D-amino acid oxidase-like deaminating enzyme/nitrite reductase/ring-hydroxylating ferredoxin subunit
MIENKGINNIKSNEEGANHYQLKDVGDGTITSGNHTPYWFESMIQPIAFAPLIEDIETDIVVIGGGIAGLTTAYCLAAQGYKVTLIEDGFIGSGETGRTTAHLTCVLDARYVDLEKTFDLNTARLVAQSHNAAIDWIENIIKTNNIECHFMRVDGFLFSHETDSNENLQDEYKATQRIGLNTQMLNKIPAIHSDQVKWCIKFSNQAQLHMMLYLKGLTDAFNLLGGKIFTETRAEKVSKEGVIANGFNIKAKHIIVATNSPINDWVTMHTKQWPYRSYVIAAKITKGKLPNALWWDTGDQNSKWVSKPYHYIRTDSFDDNYDVLIAGGEDHRTGQANNDDILEPNRYDNLIAWTRKQFPDMGEIIYKWSGQVLEPIDGLAYIGKNPGDDNIYIITGQSGNGITYSTLGALIITDLITGKENSWSKLYNPSRITLKNAGKYLHEAGNMIAQYADWFNAENGKHTSDLQPGEGAIFVSGAKHIAVFRDKENELHTCTAVCPHLGAILQWNADEKTFDCPMHGSRFTGKGNLINGPAIGDLKKVEIEESKLN